MTKRDLALASLVLLPLGLGWAGGALAGNSQTAVPQVAFQVAENNHKSGQDAETHDGAQDEGNVESNDETQDEGNVESSDGGQDEGNTESGSGGQDKGGANSEHENEGEESGEN